MSFPSMSDADIIRIDQKRQRRRMIARGAITPVFAILLGVGWGQLHRSHTVLGISIVVAAGFLLALLVAIHLLNRPQAEANTPRVLRLRADELRYQRTRQLLLVAVSALVFGLSAAVVQRPGDMRTTEWLMAGSAVLAFISNALIVSGIGIKRRIRSAMEDELSTSFRNRAIQVGFWVFVTTNSAAYLVSLVDPAFANALLPWCLTAGVGAPALYFTYLEWAAGGGE